MITDNAAILTAIAASYAPYDTHEAFGEGFVAAQAGTYRNPYDGRRDGRGQIAAQAWDRGAEAASRYARALAGYGEPRRRTVVAAEPPAERIGEAPTPPCGLDRLLDELRARL